MSKTIQHFLFGFGSVLNIFGGNSYLPDLRKGYLRDYQQLKNSGKSIMNDFTKVTNEHKQKTNRG